jgi:hypothetical protein
MALTPFAPLSLALAQHLIEDAVLRFAGYRKKDRGPAYHDVCPRALPRRLREQCG